MKYQLRETHINDIDTDTSSEYDSVSVEEGESSELEEPENSENSDGYGSGAGKSIESLNRLRRQVHMGNVYREPPAPQTKETSIQQPTEESVAITPETAMTRRRVPAVTGVCGREWTEEEYARLVALRSSPRPRLRWLQVASELNRPVKEVKQVWRERMKLDWDEDKVVLFPYNRPFPLPPDSEPIPLPAMYYFNFL
jgi:hypothetical protein